LHLFARGAAAVAGCFEETGYHLRRRDLQLTGMPLRAELEQAAAHPTLVRQPDNVFTVLVMGGSGGARTLNEIVPDALADVGREGGPLRVIHLSGRAAEAEVRAAYARAGVAAEVHGFTLDMAALYGQASLAICRAGAATCAELGAFGVPALLVPYPFAARDHQMANARAMEKTGAADVVADRDLSPAWLAAYLRASRSDPARLQRMSAAARARGRPRGTLALADLVEQCGRQHGGSRATDG
jgi:UDP-N-acetylglucosamine--N-acetylmuramyl-(pentapeptide) pyrophosphoryl-undecaprenol N-acetylglucosamine transferase